MRTDQPKNIHIKEKETHQGDLFASNRRMQRGPDFSSFQPISLGELLNKLLKGLSGLYIALRYQINRLTTNAFGEFNIPWFKIGLIALALFILSKKDVQFSFNLKSPLGYAAIDDDSEETDQMGIVQPIVFRETKGKMHHAANVDDLMESDINRYIKRFSKVAVTEMEKYGIPASINLAQGIIESWAGNHPATRQNNNHFGPPMRGHSFDSAWKNWRTHSLLLKADYPKLFKSGNSYKKWAKALSRSAYTDDRQYEKKLIEVIEIYQLYRLDE